MTYVIGLDVGGTFTDAVAADPSGALYTAKTPSTPPDFARGFENALDLLAEQAGLSTEELLARTSHVAHGTTAALNALVTGNVATVGFLTTRGHGDAITIMNVEGRYLGLSPHEAQDTLRTRKPEPLVPRSLRREVTERIDRDGKVVVTLDEQEVRTHLRELVALGVDALAVSLLWSFRNQAHELRIRELAAEEAPGLYVTLSSELTPRIREFARAATTIMNAQVGPTLRAYLDPLEARLRARKLAGPLLVMQGSGGTVSARRAPEVAITTVGSVLTGGVVGAARLAEQLGHPNVVSTDVGGTTFLVGLIVDGRPISTSGTVLGQHPLNTPALRVHAIGSGGGAIASVDRGGNLRVGPESAGASPGPACYGLGGTMPTVTDADLVTGILNPDFFLGGRQPLSRDLAEKALLEHVGRPLGLAVRDAAAAVFAVQNGQTGDLARKVVVEAGHDPRDFVVYAFGGAGPMHSFAYAAELGARELVVPLGPTAGVFSAYGLAASAVTVSAELSDPAPLPLDPARVQANFDALADRVRTALADQEIDFASVSLRREVDARYGPQISEVTTPVADGDFDEAAVAGIGDAFEAQYARQFGPGTGYREAGIQVITYRVHGVGTLPVDPDLPVLPKPAGRVEDARKGSRPVFLDLRYGWADTAVYDYRALGPGHVITGPAIVEVPTTTVVVPSGAEGTIDRFGNLAIRLA
ncbi:hydantoinase/oxoprolinase family protein [Rhizohabitans arisaemae]|uniref:hydantoinase/oxoprolinase family protein n=1 Tax=Rhizohabitans arisaemae TaxID=2720610 RepID=UPI0024B052EC|nr:hydantoinase/oxoprolinase family protein [Rhizohabitans arisaemae]